MRLAALIAATVIALSFPATAAGEPETAYSFAFESIDGKPLPLETYRGKAVMVVNTASFCGYTRQYAGLVDLWRAYRDRGLVVLGVPSNDFGGQEPGTEAEIKTFCEVNFDVDFPLAAKADVTGADAHPFYRWAARELGAGSVPKWNFHKYLVDADGRLTAWFPTATEPMASEVTRAVEAVLPPPRRKLIRRAPRSTSRPRRAPRR
jgi:glutathione peroxidase